MDEETKTEEKIIASSKMLAYFDTIEHGVQTEFKIASEARAKGFDPVDRVEVKLAKNMAERVVGLISTVAPQIVDSGVVGRIIELEQEYGKLDWRVALKIAEEIAAEKFCKFDNKVEAIEVGVRTGFAYQTVGVVTAPLEGLTNIEEKDRLDGKGKYLCLNFAGPVRNAGGTAAASCVLIADYVRKKTGYLPYDPTEDEVKRIFVEISDYHERVTNLQYYPSEKEMEFMGKNMPIEINGDQSEKFEVSNYKDLPRIKTNIIRSGYCLLYSSCLPLKAEKLWKQLSKWGNDFDMDQWNFMEEFVKIKKEVHAHGKKASAGDEGNITPDYTFIADLVAGRPVIGHPLAHGGFRLRFGRSRTSGYSAQSIHPASMHVLNDYVATATQLKVERPGKGAAYTSCDTIEGPIVKIDDGSVVYLGTDAKAREYKKRVVEVLYLGDVLINYGDFLNRAHKLLPPGYCEEWWILEFQEAVEKEYGRLDLDKLSMEIGVDKGFLRDLFEDSLRTDVNFSFALKVSKRFKIPLHPKYTFHFTALETEQLISLIKWVKGRKIEKQEEKEKFVLKIEEDGKRALELLGIPHNVSENGCAILTMSYGDALICTLGLDTKSEEDVLKLIEENKEKKIMDIVKSISSVMLRDKSGLFIGCRMGRPEKAKMRKMTGTPHVLFPIGEEGGRLRSFQAALEVGKVTAEFPIRFCDACQIETPLNVCEKCGVRTRKQYACKVCGVVDEEVCKRHGKADASSKREIDLRRIYNSCLKMADLRAIPDLIKGVRGTSNREHIPEHLLKGILRAYNGVFVNKDGTIRYDCSEIPVTHFKPKEIGVGVERLRELGYEVDIKGRSLGEEDQILELMPQDILLPCCPESPDEMADNVLIKTTKFIDDILVSLYGMQPYYNVKKREDLVGHFVIGLAPHTSAGSVCRILGFSKTQGFFSHPYMHAAMRRDCDGDESCFFLLLDAFLNFSQKYLPNSRGGMMDAPLVLTSILAPGEVDDMAFDIDIVWKYPLEFYNACLEYKKPWDVKLKMIKDTLNTEEQYEGMGFTHDTDDFNVGINCSAYKILPSMEEKLKGQMEIAEKLRSVKTGDVARLVIERHFIRDTKGNLRKFSQQQFRCVKCNTKYRRPPLIGKCTECGGKIIFTISEGSIVKYLQPSISLAEKYDVPIYLQQSLELLKRRVDGVFGKEKDRQEGLGKWFG
jgi:DNA polymerase II large subunit